MKVRPQFFFSLVLLVFFAYFVWEAWEWRLQARLYPWAIGIPMIVLALVQIWLELKGVSPVKTAGATPVDFQFEKPVDPELARRRTVNIFAWILGFFLAIWLLGFSLAITLLLFFYLKVQSREPWVLSIVLTAAGWLLFWGLFDRLLHLPFPEAQLFMWLGM
ncbi:MAG: tripartite tricarboxylate transporter TctB family protein [Deltaproteobacteria bacterium]|nr:tripartite tricarboxylate transporter TctB family protein [Deltaproteobacteria bacterium]